ncbi:hypothetical protein R8Z50_21180 [Longispora sp. K20-0274]|uniref:hypothetical protein n=1 Tax=Longispora sp. K20-0274 TaxID=3088255 RepID=UPI00399B0D61
MRWFPLTVKVTIALAAGGFLAVSVATAKPPRPAAEPPAVVTDQRALDLGRLTDRPRSSPTPTPTRARPPQPTPTPPPTQADDPDLPVDEDEDELPEFPG